MRRFSLIAVIVLLSLIPFAESVSAGKGWCRRDPIISLNGAQVQILVGIPYDEQFNVVGPIRVSVSVPRVVKKQLLATDSGFNNFGEAFNFADSGEPIAADGSFVAYIDVSVPMADGRSVPMEVSVIPATGPAVYVYGDTVGVVVAASMAGGAITGTSVTGASVTGAASIDGSGQDAVGGSATGASATAAETTSDVAPLGQTGAGDELGSGPASEADGGQAADTAEADTTTEPAGTDQSIEETIDASGGADQPIGDLPAADEIAVEEPGSLQPNEGEASVDPTTDAGDASAATDDLGTTAGLPDAGSAEAPVDASAGATAEEAVGAEPTAEDQASHDDDPAVAESPTEDAPIAVEAEGDRTADADEQEAAPEEPAAAGAESTAGEGTASDPDIDEPQPADQAIDEEAPESAEGDQAAAPASPEAAPEDEPAAQAGVTDESLDPTVAAETEPAIEPTAEPTVEPTVEPTPVAEEPLATPEQPVPEDLEVVDMPAPTPDPAPAQECGHLDGEGKRDRGSDDDPQDDAPACAGEDGGA